MNGDQGDYDNDDIGNACDNCLFTPNPSQINSDGDASGDMCDNDDDNDEHSKCNYQTTQTLIDKANNATQLALFSKKIAMHCVCPL